MALEDIDIYALTGGGSPIEGVSVGLYDNATKAKLLTSNTDATGKASFAAVDSDLNGGLYEIRVNPGFPGVITGGVVQTVAVLEAPVAPSSNIFDVTITPASLPTAANPNLCRCSGFFKDPAGRYKDDVILKFTQHNIPTVAYLSSGDVETFSVVPSEISVRTSKDVATNTKGYASVDLYRKGVYSVTMSGFIGNPRIIQVPDAAAANLADVLFPVVSQIKWHDDDVQVVPADSPSVNIAVGEKILTVEAIFRSGNVAAGSEIVLTSSDGAVFTVSRTNENVALIGVAAGQATLEVTRAPTTESGILVQSSMPAVSGSLTVNVA